MKKLSINIFSSDSIEQAINEIYRYKNELTYKTDLFVQKLAQKGVEIARAEISSHEAIETYELFWSMAVRKEYSNANYSTWKVLTDCDWACYVEFGTGIIGANAGQHPKAAQNGYVADGMGHGDSGWVYYKDGQFYWTQGYPSRPFMYETALQLQENSLILETAREVFGV